MKLNHKGRIIIFLGFLPFGIFLQAMDVDAPSPSISSDPRRTDVAMPDTSSSSETQNTTSSNKTRIG